MKIFIMTLTGKTIPVEIHDADTVRTGKESIEQSQGIPVSQQRLIFRGKQLEDDKTFTELGIKERDKLFLVLKLGIQQKIPQNQQNQQLFEQRVQSLQQQVVWGVNTDPKEMESLLQSKFSNIAVGKDSSIYLNGVMEYMLAEVLELSGNVARSSSRDRISVDDIQKAVTDDMELAKVSSTLPKFHQELSGTSSAFSATATTTTQNSSSALSEDIIWIKDGDKAISSHLVGNPNEFLKRIPKLMLMMKSQDKKEKLTATRFLRTLLSHEDYRGLPKIQMFIPILVTFLMDETNPELQFETCWSLSNICSGNSEDVKAVLRHNVVPIFIKLLASKEENIREQAVWGIGNIAGDSARCRDYVHKLNILPPIMKVIEQQPSLTCLRTCAWCLSNLCRGIPKPTSYLKISEQLLPLLAFLVHNSDIEVLTDVLWCLSYVSDWGDTVCGEILQMNVGKRCVELMNHHHPSVQTPALRTIGNIVSGSNEYTTRIVDMGVLSSLRRLIAHQKQSIRKECVWSVSNVCAGNHLLLQKVLDTNGLFSKIMEICNNYDEKDEVVKREAIICMCNSIEVCNDSQLFTLIHTHGVVKTLCQNLVSTNVQILNYVLTGIERILKKGKTVVVGENPYIKMIEEEGGVKKIEELQTHQNKEIYEIALRILETFFDVVI